jgi:hypothetical protein
MRRSFIIPLSFSLLAAATRLPAVDSTMLNLLMPDAKMVSGVDVERTRNSPFGQYFLTQMGARETGLAKFQEMTGFDPRKDVFEVIVASSDSGESLKTGAATVVIARGTFDLNKLLQSATAHGGTVKSYNGTQVIEGKPHAGEAPWVGFLGNLIVAGAQPAVKTTIDRYRSAKKADALLTSRIQAASSKHDAWFLTTVSPSVLAGNLTSNPNVKGAMTGELVQGIESMTAGVKFGANVVMSGEAMARSDKDANALVDVMKFFASMAQSNAPKSGPAAMLDAVQMTADGRTVKFSLTTPEQDFEKLFAPGMNRVRSRARTTLD